MNRTADVFLGIIGTIFLWHGLWNLCDILESQLDPHLSKMQSSAVFTTVGIILVLLESHKHIINDIMDYIY